MNIMRTGARFKATDELGRTFLYEVVGIDMDNILTGNGFGCIVLEDLFNHTKMYVDAEWLRKREIGQINNSRSIIEVPCTAGVLCAQNGGDPDYPEIFTYLRRPDGTEIDICGVEGDGIIPEGVAREEYDGQTRCHGGLNVFLYTREP